MAQSKGLKPGQPAPAAGAGDILGNWLSDVIQRCRSSMRVRVRQVHCIVDGIKSRPEGKQVARRAALTLRAAIHEGLDAAEEREAQLKEVPIGPDPAKLAAQVIFRRLKVPEPQGQVTQGEPERSTTKRRLPR